jgi:hypothetical protein
MATVIDSLIVKLGLDPRDYKKGAAEFERVTKETETTVRKSTESMASGFRRVAAEVIGLFVAVRSVQDVVGFFERVNASTRQLGLDSNNFGIAANELRDWQNAAVLAGGSAEGVTQTIASLQKSLFNLQYTGAVSDQIIFLQRLGVQFRSATGQVAPFKSILMQTAAIMEKNGRSRAENFQYLQAAGFDAGSINLILNGTKALAAFYEQQKKLPQLTQADIAASTRLAQAWELLKEKFVVAAQKLITDAEPALTRLFALFQRGIDWINAHQEDITRFFEGFFKWFEDTKNIDSVKGFFSDLATIVGGLARGMGFLASAILSVTEAYGKLVAGTSVPLPPLLRAAVALWSGVIRGAGGNANRNPLTGELLNHNRGNIKAVGDQPRDARGFRVFANDQEGIAAINHQLDLYAARGINTISGIVNTYAPASDNNDVSAYISALMSATGRGANDVLGAADRAPLIRAIVLHETGAGPQITVPRSSMTPQAPATPGLYTRGPPTSARGGPQTSVDIGTMNIQTQATDANGIMADAWRSVQRKFQVAQAEPGLA